MNILIKILKTPNLLIVILVLLFLFYFSNYRYQYQKNQNLTQKIISITDQLQFYKNEVKRYYAIAHFTEQQKQESGQEYDKTAVMINKIKNNDACFATLAPALIVERLRQQATDNSNKRSTLQVNAPYVMAQPISFAMMPQLVLSADNSVTHYQGSDHVLVNVKMENYQGQVVPLNESISLSGSTATPDCEYTADKAGKEPLQEVNGVPIVPIKNGQAIFYVSTAQTNNCSVVGGFTLPVNNGKGSDTVTSTPVSIPFVEQSLGKGVIKLSRHDILADGTDSSDLTFQMTDSKGQPIQDFYVVVSAPQLAIKTPQMEVKNGIFTTPITSEVAHFDDTITLTAYANKQDYENHQPPIAGPLEQTLNAHAYITGFAFGTGDKASNGAQADGKDQDIGYLTLADAKGDKQLPYENFVIQADNTLIGPRVLMSNGGNTLAVPLSSKKFAIAQGLNVTAQLATRVGDQIKPINDIPKDKMSEAVQSLDYRYIGYLKLMDGPHSGIGGSLAHPVWAKVNVQDAEGNNVTNMDTRIVASTMSQEGSSLPQPAPGVLFHYGKPTSMTVGDNPINWKSYEGTDDMPVTVTATKPGKYYVSYINAVCLWSDTSCPYGDPQQYKQIQGSTGFEITFNGDPATGTPKLVSATKTHIAADGKDSSVLTVEAVDANGGVIPNALLYVIRSDTGQKIPVATNDKGIGIVPFSSEDASQVNISATYIGTYPNPTVLAQMEKQSNTRLLDSKVVNLTTLYFDPYVVSMTADGEANTKPNVDNKLADNQQYYTVTLKVASADPKQTTYPVVTLPVSTTLGEAQQQGQSIKAIQTTANGIETFEVLSSEAGPDTISVSSVGHYSSSLQRFFDSPYHITASEGKQTIANGDESYKVVLTLRDSNNNIITNNTPLIMSQDSNLISQNINEVCQPEFSKNGVCTFSFGSKVSSTVLKAQFATKYQHPTFEPTIISLTFKPAVISFSGTILDEKSNIKQSGFPSTWINIAGNSPYFILKPTEDLPIKNISSSQNFNASLIGNNEVKVTNKTPFQDISVGTPQKIFIDYKNDFVSNEVYTFTIKDIFYVDPTTRDYDGLYSYCNNANMQMISATNPYLKALATDWGSLIQDEAYFSNTPVSVNCIPNPYGGGETCTYSAEVLILDKGWATFESGPTSITADYKYGSACVLNN